MIFSLLLLGVWVVAVNCDQLLCSDQSYCLNGGVCTLSSATAASRRCSSSEVYHDDNCFSFHPQMPWNDAASFCHDRLASLPSPMTSSDQVFLSNFIQGSIDGSGGKNASILGAWSSIRSVSNGSSPSWVRYPGSILIQETFWQPGEPNIYPNWNDVCVSLSSDTLYREWLSLRCDAENYVVCQRPLEFEDKELIPQCSCSTDFEGMKCESPRSQDSSSQSSVCPPNSFFFSCQNGETIMVDYASFGAVEGYVCSTSSTESHTCSNPHSLQTITNKCQGLTFCESSDLLAWFPETPCPVKEELQLQYRMHCSKDVQASCPAGAVYNSGRCFSFEVETKKSKLLTKEEAVEQCRIQGGQLVSGVTVTSNDELTRQARKKAKTADFWLDLEAKNGSFAWGDGSAMTFSPPSSDLSASLQCVVLSLSSDSSKWQSKDCVYRANYICEFAPTGGQPRPKESTPTVQKPAENVFKGDGSSKAVDDIFGETRFCPEETVKGVRYPRTRVCMEAREMCPDPENIEGTVVRYCNCKTLKWDSPDTTNCTHKWVREVRTAMENGDPAEEISNRLAQNLIRTVARQLYGGDIVGSVELSDEVLTQAKNQFSLLTDRNDRQKRTANFTQSLGSSGDELLSAKAALVWAELDKYKRITHASTLMSVLEQSTLLLADYTIDSKQNLNYVNWAMEIDVRPPDSFVPPRGGATVISNGQAIQDDERNGEDGTELTNQSFQFAPETQSSTVQFDKINKSPIINMPNIGTLKESSNARNPAAASAAFFHPGGAEDSGASLDRSRLRLGYYVFTSMGALLSQDEHSIVNSHVIGASVNDASRSISLPDDEPVTFTFYHLQKSGVSNPRCVYWDLEINEWSTNGCEMISTNKDATECSCNHLTSFAILMDVSGRVSRYSGSLASALDVVSTIGCAISIVCLILSLAVFTLFRSLYNVRNTIHRNLCFCLLVAELTFVIGMDRTSNPTGCSVVALFLHYFFLASFCWMLLEGYQLYLMLIQVFEPTRTHILLYYLFCYGFPAAVVAVSAGVAWQNYGTDAYCWINTTTPTIWAFVVPIIIVILANIIFLLIALRVVLSVKSRDKTKTDRVVGWLKGSAMLLCLLGITWVFGFLTAVKGGTGTVFAWIFTILNCTQGVFIFFLHVVMNDKVRSSVVRWLRTGVCCLPQTSSSNYNSRSYLSSRQRFMNMMKSQSPSDPSTASTDDKERQLTPNSKTNEWLRRMSSEMAESATVSSSERRDSDDVINMPTGNDVVLPVDGQSNNSSTDPRGSEVLEFEPMGKQSAVKRKKFPLGMSEKERGSCHRDGVVVHRF